MNTVPPTAAEATRPAPTAISAEVGPTATSLGPLKAAAEKQGKVDFTNLWAGQAVRMGREMPATELTRALAGAALARFAQMAGYPAMLCPRLRRKSSLCYTAG